VIAVNSKKLPSFWIFFWISMFLSLVGLGGLAYLFLETLPYLGPRWLFFFFLMLAISGLALPITYFLNRRFPSTPPADSSIVLREAMWFGIYACSLAWLQLGRVLTPGMALVLATGLILVEFLLRLGERSLWTPKEEVSSKDE
jgi:hypothetical protein